MSFGGKTLGAHVRYPDLQRAQAPLPHAPSVLADPFSHPHGNMLHVTLNPGSRIVRCCQVEYGEIEYGGLPVTHCVLHLPAPSPEEKTRFRPMW